MEPAKIDWKKVEWVFVEDPAYEHFNAPKWVDLSSPYLHLHTDAHDDSWFCTPECKHPKTAEDFFKSTPTSTSASTSSSSRSQLRRPAKIYEILPLGERSPGDVIFKRKGATQSRVPLTKSPQNKSHEDSENQNPNLSTPLNPRCIAKCIIKSSAEKTQATDDASQTNSLPRLRSTLSARNLFAGRDILNQISEFCSELKKMATRTKEKENVETQNLVKDVEAQPNEAFGGEGKEWKPLLGVSAEKSNSMNKNDIKENQSRNE